MSQINARKPVIAALVLSVASAGAGAALAARAPIKYLDKPFSPRGLPGDNLPPFLMLDDSGKLIPEPPPPPGGRHPPSPGKPESTAAGPSLALSVAGAQAAISACRKLGALGGVAVVDIAGDARAMLSADGADGSHVFVAQRKALVALEFGMPGIKVRDLAKQGDADVLRRITPAMFVNLGSYPITSKGKVVGAIGYSGADDEPCAKAGAAYIQARMPK